MVMRVTGVRMSSFTSIVIPLNIKLIAIDGEFVISYPPPSIHRMSGIVGIVL